MSKHTASYLAYIWEFLREHRDRRLAQRYATNPRHEAALAWHDGNNHLTARAVLLDLSNSGARVCVGAIVPNQGHVWVRLVEPEHTDWVPATIVGCRARRKRQSSDVRLRFDKDCPYSFFKAAVNGFHASDGYMTLR